MLLKAISLIILSWTWCEIAAATNSFSPQSGAELKSAVDGCAELPPSLSEKEFKGFVCVPNEKITVTSMQVHKTNFIEAAVRCGALKFGSFKLKSGRISPYFFNAGAFANGAAMRMLGECYAAAVRNAQLPVDVLFGPAYKGIPLVSCTAMFLDCPFAYNRKERKDHGEGGVLVGCPVRGRRVVILDDVIPAGTAVREAIDILTKAGAIISGVAVALDRQEIAKEGETLSAVQVLRQKLKVPIISVVNLKDVTNRLRSSKSSELVKHLLSMETYARKYGIQSSL